MIDCREVYLLTQRQEEWDFIHEKKFACEEDSLVQLYQYCRDLHLIPGHYIRIFLIGPAFKCCNVIDPHLLHDFNILDCHWKVIDLVDANNPLVVLS